MQCTISFITRNSGAPGLISNQALHTLSLSSLPFRSLPSPLSFVPLPFPPFPFPFFLTPLSHPSVPSLHSPSPYLPPLPLITARRFGGAIAPSAGTGAASPPNTFLCSSQPKICKSVNLFSLELGALHSQGPLDFVPTLLTHCYTTAHHMYAQISSNDQH